MKSNQKHDQVEQILIYLHQDIHAVLERLQAINQSVKTISSRLDAVLTTIEVQKNESHRE